MAAGLAFTGQTAEHREHVEQWYADTAAMSWLRSDARAAFAIMSGEPNSCRKRHSSTHIPQLIQVSAVWRMVAQDDFELNIFLISIEPDSPKL